MWLVGGIIAALLIYLVILLAGIAPLQGGLKSSTEVLNGTIPSSVPLVQSNTPLQLVGLWNTGRSLIVAAVMQTHVVLSNIMVGGSWIILFTALLYHRSRNMRYKNLARSMTLLNVILISAMGTFGGAVWPYLDVLWPTFAMHAFKVWWWPFFAYTLFYAIIITLTFVFWYGWDRVRPGLHLFIGLLWALTVTLQMAATSMLAAGMLTPNIPSIPYNVTGPFPVQLGAMLLAWYNPTVLDLTFHRLGGSIGFFGFLTASIAILHFRSRRDFASKKQWDWVAAYGMVWGLLGLSMQAVIGHLYMNDIMAASSGAFEMIMHGPRAWAMLMVTGLVSALFLTVIAYFISRRDQLLSPEETKHLTNLFWAFLGIVAFAAIILVQPAWLGGTMISDSGSWINPIGIMPLKYLALFIMAGVGFAVLAITAIVLSSRARERAWGFLGRSSLVAAFTSGVLGMAILLVMGYYRESARAPWTIYQILPTESLITPATDIPTPLPISAVLIMWAVILLFVIALVWFIAKFTSYHPTESDSV